MQPETGPDAAHSIYIVHLLLCMALPVAAVTVFMIVWHPETKSAVSYQGFYNSQISYESTCNFSRIEGLHEQYCVGAKVCN